MLLLLINGRSLGKEIIKLIDFEQGDLGKLIVKLLRLINNFDLVSWKCQNTYRKKQNDITILLK